MRDDIDETLMNISRANRICIETDDLICAINLTLAIYVEMNVCGTY